MQQTNTTGIAVIGGDERLRMVARALSATGRRVYGWGLTTRAGETEDTVLCDSWEEALERADTVLLPLPTSVDGLRVHCPFVSTHIAPRLLSLLPHLKGKLVLGGRIEPSFAEACEQQEIAYVDYFRSEQLQWKNALPTAEGALLLALQELPVTLFGTAVAVVGYGRIGSLLAQRLFALGADVTVLARNAIALTRASLMGMHVYPLDGDDAVWKGLPSGCRAVFNTVPTVLFTQEALLHVPQNCVLIDLASVPGGIDHTAAARLGLRSVWGTSLPGKLFPECASVFLAETISEVLKENGR